MSTNWVHRDFLTIGGLLEFLNSLDKARQLSSKAIIGAHIQLYILIYLEKKP